MYFYEGSEDIAERRGRDRGAGERRLRARSRPRLTAVIPIITYASHNDFQQTNVSLSHIDEGVGGFTELFKNRVVIPFTGSYHDLRHVLYHELAHVFMFDIVYGGLMESVVRQAYMNPVPLWFAEGLAEHVSAGLGPRGRDDPPRPHHLRHRRARSTSCTAGTSCTRKGSRCSDFVAERYGREKIAEIVRHLARTSQHRPGPQGIRRSRHARPVGRVGALAQGALLAGGRGARPRRRRREAPHGPHQGRLVLQSRSRGVARRQGSRVPLRPERIHRRVRRLEPRRPAPSEARGRRELRRVRDAPRPADRFRVVAGRPPPVSRGQGGEERRDAGHRRRDGRPPREHPLSPRRHVHPLVVAVGRPHRLHRYTARRLEPVRHGPGGQRTRPADGRLPRRP